MNKPTITVCCPLCGSPEVVELVMTHVQIVRWDDGRYKLIPTVTSDGVVHRCPDPTKDNPKTAYGYPVGG